MRSRALSHVASPGGGAAATQSSRPGLLRFRLDRHEVAGGLADIGVMIPLACGVAATAGLSLGGIFLCVAAVYAIAALAFRVPVPVQPMKAMAASVIALGLSAPVVAMASLEIGLLFLLLAVTPLARYISILFPVAVVRGIQLAIGLLLMKSALRMTTSPAALPGADFTVSLGSLTVTIGAVVALGILAALLFARERPRIPGSLVILGVGAAVGVVLIAAGVSEPAQGNPGFSLPLRHLPDLHDAWLALFAVVLPQLPLSLGNSVFATDDVLRHYYGNAARRVSPRSLCLSLGLVNLGSGMLGGMALCHGSGGATAHYRLGARTAGATLAAAVLYAALAFGAVLGLSPLLVPGAVLSGLLLFVGVEHCLLLTSLSRGDDIVCALFIAVVTFATGNLAIGFIGGWVLYSALKRSALGRWRLRWPAITERSAQAARSVEADAP